MTALAAFKIIISVIYMALASIYIFMVVSTIWAWMMSHRARKAYISKINEPNNQTEKV